MADATQNGHTVASIESYFAARGVTPETAGDGRYTMYVPLGSGSDERLQVSIAATDRSAGVMARVRAVRAVPREQFPQALMACNEWNRRNPTPRAALAQRGDGAVAECLLEDWLPASDAPAPDQLARFVDAVVGGARRFWASPTMTELAPRVS
jgi:hypothetical protein